MKRRSFLSGTIKAGAGAFMAGSVIDLFAKSPLAPLSGNPFKREKLDTVRIGMVGVGGMGTAHLSNFLKIEGCEVVAVCDIREDHARRAHDMIVGAGFKAPKLYTRGERDFERLCRQKGIDLVFTATPWEWHVPVCVEAMKNGKHAATEVPAALTVDECWELISWSEQSGKHCIMMENCNYDREEMMILKMVHEGVLGELLHARCGYLHDLRAVKHDLDGEGAWRRAYSMVANGDLYPTHGLGPVAQCLNINRGNYFFYLVSFATKSRGLHKYAVERFGPESPQAQEEFRLGDIVTTMIRTMNGETILVTHDTSNPRPYSRDIMVQGTRGLVQKYPEPLLHIEGMSPAHRWEKLSEYKSQFDHPLWKQLEADAEGAGHGGMDYLEDYRLIHALRNGEEPDMDVYDAAVLSAVVELSSVSIERGSWPVRFPDFTRGRWKEKRELPVMSVPEPVEVPEADPPSEIKG